MFFFLGWRGEKQGSENNEGDRPQVIENCRVEPHEGLQRKQTNCSLVLMGQDENFAPSNLLLVLLVLLSIPLLFLLLLLGRSLRGLVLVLVVRVGRRAHGVHGAHGAVADGGVGVAVAPRRV